LECAFGVVVVGKILMSRDLLKFYSVRFGFEFRMCVGDIDFEVISAAEKIQNKFPKKTYHRSKI
jgi:hypothetical protein